MEFKQGQMLECPVCMCQFEYEEGMDVCPICGAPIEDCYPVEQ